MNETNISNSQGGRYHLSEAAKGWTEQIACPAITLLSSGIIAGLAFTGIGLMTISTITWILSGAGWFCGIALLTGGMFLASSTALCLSQLTHARDVIYENLKQREKQPTT